MDPNTLLASVGNTPLAALAPWFADALAIATLIMLVLPEPSATNSSVYVTVYGAVHRIANLKAPPAAPDAAPAPVKMPSATIAALLMAIMLPVMLGACAIDPATKAQLQQAVKVACDVDGMVVPIADPVVLGLVPQSAPIITVDQALVHPAVVAVCKGYGGTPAMAAPATVTPAK